MKLQITKRARGLLADLQVYSFEWFYPFKLQYLVRYVAVLAALLFAAWRVIWQPYFKNIPYRSARYAVVRIERIDHLRSGPKEGSAMRDALVFRVECQDVEFPASFRAEPGEYVAVNYVVDFKGRVSIYGISPAKH